MFFLPWIFVEGPQGFGSVEERLVRVRKKKCLHDDGGNRTNHKGL
jgi:hypothetical protein